MRIVGDNSIRWRQYSFAGPIILFEFDDFERRKVVWKRREVLGVCTTPGIDGLVIVAHYSKRLAVADKEADKFVLWSVSVLVFVD